MFPGITSQVFYKSNALNAMFKQNHTPHILTHINYPRHGKYTHIVAPHNFVRQTDLPTYHICHAHPSYMHTQANANAYSRANSSHSHAHIQ